MTKEEAIQDLKDKVGEFMLDAARMAAERIDKLQASGVDIATDHINADGPYQIPRDFIAAFADEMKFQYGQVRQDAPRAQKKRIKNYSLMM